MWTAIGTIAASIIGGLVAYFGTKRTNQTSQDISNQNIAFQEKENEITRAREDNAQQRAAADLQAAGLSKTLAAGNPASATALSAPQANYTYQSPMQKAVEHMQLKETFLNLKNLENQTKKTEAEVDNINAQTDGVNISNSVAMENHEVDVAEKKANTALLEARIEETKASTRLSNIEGDYKTQQIETDINYKLAQIDLTNANIDKVVAETVKYVEETYKIGKETQLVVQDLVNEKIKQRQLEHDLERAEYFGLPVGQMPGGLLGGAFSTGVATKSALRSKLLEWSKNATLSKTPAERVTDSFYNGDTPWWLIPTGSSHDHHH